MDKWHNQFDKLKRQWSEYNWIESDYKPHDKRQIAKIGVAWVVKLPGEYFRKPVGWEVEIIDTPIGISERSNNLLKWLRHPPTSVYDNISLFNDSSDITLENSSDRQDISYRRNYGHPLSLDDPPQKFLIPPNEYEIFKKTCCECKEKSFKNTSTDYESDIKGSRPNHVPYKLSSKASYLGLLLEDDKNIKKDRNTSYLPNHTTYNNFEQELHNHILDASTQSSIDQITRTNHSRRISTPKNHKRRVSRGKHSNVTNQSIETSSVLSGVRSYREPSLISKDKQSIGNGTINKSISPIHDQGNNHSAVLGETTTETFVPPNSRRRSSGPHIPSVDIFDDNILTRGGSLDQYRDNDLMERSRHNNSEYRRPSLNGHRNNHRHHHRSNGSKEVSIDTTIEDHYVPSEYVPSELQDEFEEREETIL